VLDPVGAGASWLRTQCAKDLMQEATIIRGNATEIIAISKEEDSFKTLGVEAVHDVSDAKKIAETLAKKLNCTIVISGKEDFITTGSQQTSLHFGSALMPLITGMGCTLTAVIAAFKAVIPNAFEAAEIATAYFGLCGNLAAKKTQKPGTFRAFFIDELYAADFTTMKEFANEL
jgi:hydroxyethylthiazole kinase